MLFDDLKDYFEKFVTQYKPYKDISLYRELIDFLLKRYLSDSYQNIPSNFKKAFEKQIIPVDFIDLLLTSNGFPKEVIIKLSFDNKFILLNTLMDFNRYKGSIKLVSKIASIFNQNINIYELYIDFRNSDWIFFPRPIHITDAIKSDVLTTTLDFDIISSQINNFLITKNQLSALKAKKKLCLPIKSNLLFMDFKDVEKGDTILNLFASITLKQFRNELITLFFDNITFTFTLENVYKLWYYINLRFINATTTFTHPNFSFIVFDIDHPNLSSFSISDIPILETQINNIKTTNQASEFYFNNITTPLKVERSWNVNVSISDLESAYRTQLGPDIIDFVNEIIDSSLSVVQKKSNILKVLDNIINSLITWSVINNKDVSYLIESLSKISFSAKETPSFLILDHLKPFHTEIAVQSGKILRVNDVFNSAISENKISFVTDFIKTSVMSISDKLTTSINLILQTNVHEISHDENFIVELFFNEVQNIMSDLIALEINHENHSISNISDNFNLISTPP